MDAKLLQAELAKVGLRKVELARELGIEPGTVYRWTDEKVPQYVWAYLSLKGMKS